VKLEEEQRNWNYGEVFIFNEVQSIL